MSLSHHLFFFFFPLVSISVVYLFSNRLSFINIYILLLFKVYVRRNNSIKKKSLISLCLILFYLQWFWVSRFCFPLYLRKKKFVISRRGSNSLIHICCSLITADLTGSCNLIRSAMNLFPFSF